MTKSMTQADSIKIGKTNPGSTILIVDDRPNDRRNLSESLSAKGWHPEEAEDPHTALATLDQKEVEGVIVSLDMAEGKGLSLLKTIKDRNSDMPVVVTTASPQLETAVDAMKNGAVDYLISPLSRSAAQEVASRIVNKGNGIGHPRLHEDRDDREVGKIRIIGSDDKFCRLLKRAEAVASSKATVLIYGESGTGKEVFARYIHEVSDRREGPFVALNCAALPEGLLESELFGYEKGAFTGAAANKKGKFELAHGGTLLLDEIGEIPLHLQAKLLRVLQEEEVDRLGGSSPLSIDVHVIVTTNRNLEAAIRDGSFREDLYYRLNVIPITIPPLRERQDDIFFLADYFIKKFSVRYNKRVKKLSRGARECFRKYHWPGNVREMENLIERAVLLSEGDYLEPHDFWDEIPFQYLENSEQSVSGDGEEADSVPQVDLVSFTSGDSEELPTLKDVERQMILQALYRTDNNRTSAARILGVSVRTLRNKLNEYRNSGLIS
ncbi:MAG: sigma-54-dependent transcriptional regulator [Desulfurivibrionaceae bacterium]